MTRLRIGDPLDPATQVGAITTDAQNDAILGLIRSGRDEGARLVCGGDAVAMGRGKVVAPMLFGDVRAPMALAREAIFGPVLSIFPFETTAGALALANDTQYGLAASLWTRDFDTAIETMRRVQGGAGVGRHDPQRRPGLPIGGFKPSGWGRESGIDGVEEDIQVKSVHIELGRRAHWVA